MSVGSKSSRSVFFRSIAPNIVDLRFGKNINRVLIISLSMAISSFSVPTTVRAQISTALDYSNPNVSVDFSVLEDGGIGSGIMAPAGSSGSSGHLIPGTRAPVSTLYITPLGSFGKIDVPPGDKKIASQKIKLIPPVSKTIAPPKAVTVKQEAPPAPPAPPAAKIVEKVPVKEPAKPVQKIIKEAVEEKTAPELAKEEVAPPPEPAKIEKPVEKEMEVAKVEPKAPPPPAPEPVPAPAPMSPVAKAPVTAPAPPTIPKAPEVKAPEIKAPEVMEKKPLQLDAKKIEAKKPVEPPAPPAAVKTPEPPKVVATPPKAEPAPSAPPAPSVASLPPAGATLVGGQSLRVLFEAETAKLPTEARDELRDLAKSMVNQEGLRLQLLAYAGGAKMSSSVARRLSLSRALAVRSYLIESGVRSTRIDVRALGNKTSDAETDRVDITVIER